MSYLNRTGKFTATVMNATAETRNGKKNIRVIFNIEHEVKKDGTLKKVSETSHTHNYYMTTNNGEKNKVCAEVLEKAFGVNIKPGVSLESIAEYMQGSTVVIDVGTFEFNGKTYYGVDRTWEYKPTETETNETEPFEKVAAGDLVFG